MKIRTFFSKNYFDENKPHLHHNEMNQIEKYQNIPHTVFLILDTSHLHKDSIVHKVVVSNNPP